MIMKSLDSQYNTLKLKKFQQPFDCIELAYNLDNGYWANIL